MVIVAVSAPQIAASTTGMDAFTDIGEWLSGAINYFRNYPEAALLIVATVVIFMLLKAIHRGIPVQTDDRRAFSPYERAEAKRLAGGRCEHSTLTFRCRNSGMHADHIYPWSRGGATAMTNCQSLCQRHNLQKSARIPSRFYIARLARRRRRYFPADQQPVIEWRLGRAS